MLLRRERLRQVGLPLGMSAVGLVDALVVAGPPIALEVLVAVLAPVPLLWRERFPATTALLAMSSILVQVAIGVDLGEVIAPVLVLGTAAYSAGLRLPLRRAVLVGLGLVAFIWASEVLEEGIEGSNPVFAFFLTFGSLSMGRVLRTRHEALAAAATAEREVAVTHERTRIARELHDLIAHTLSVMVVQASAAEQVLDTDPQRAKQALSEVQRAGRDALSETARLLDLLRDGHEDGAPQPGLGDLAALVRAAPGLEVDLRVDEPLPTLPPGAEVSLCRIVQEALTNVLKHSASRRPRVRVGADGAEVVVRVEDPGPARRLDALPGGHGLVGMRERVEMYGGRLEVGPVGGGWSVEARMPAR